MHQPGRACGPTLRRPALTASASALWVGLDVAKDCLDVHVRPTGLAFRVANDEAGITDLVGRLRDLQPAALVLEATGGYEIPVVAALAAAGLAPAVVNPRPARRFAEGVGRLAKTDPLDAAARAHFAEAVRPEPQPVPDAEARALGELLARRRQLVPMRVSEQHRLPTASGAIRKNIQRHIDYLDRQTRGIEGDLAAAVQASPAAGQGQEGRLNRRGPPPPGHPECLGSRRLALARKTCRRHLTTKTVTGASG
jgi:transposase